MFSDNKTFQHVFQSSVRTGEQENLQIARVKVGSNGCRGTAVYMWKRRGGLYPSRRTRGQAGVRIAISLWTERRNENLADRGLLVNDDQKC